MQRIAILLALLWAASWTVFITLASARSGFFVPAALFAVVMFGSIAAAWKWPAAGGALLMMEALGAWIVFGPAWLRWSRPGSLILLTGTIIAPPLVSGVILLVHGVRQYLKHGRGIQALHLNG